MTITIPLWAFLFTLATYAVVGFLIGKDTNVAL